MMTQLNVKEGIRQFGERGNAALLKELNQLHEQQALMPEKEEDMSYEEKKKALRYLIFIKEKRDSTINTRGCADRRSQSEYTNKVDTSSPTVSLEAMLLMCATDAKEGRYIAVTDIPGAFLHVDMEQDVHMLLEGTTAELIMKLEPSLYRKSVWKNKHGKPMLYVKLRKALYGTLQIALLFWRLLSDTLMEWGFQLNDYDKCVANKTINGKQCTIIWHVGNLKISHTEKKVVDHIIDKLNKKFREYSPLCTNTEVRIPRHDVGLYDKRKVMLSMYEYINKMLTEPPSDMNRVSKVQAAGHFFSINPDTTKLLEEKAQLFHHLVAKLLYLCRHTIQDIQTAVEFLCTRVKDPDKDDYKKLTKVMQYIRNTKYLTLSIEPSAAQNGGWTVHTLYTRT